MDTDRRDPTRRPRSRRLARLGAALLLVALPACQALEQLPDRLFDRRTPRERYEAALHAAGLTATAMASDWLASAGRSLADAPRITAAYAEQGYLQPAEPLALAYRLTARRGQRIHFDFIMPDDSVTQIFLDAWAVEGDTVPTFRHVVSADSGRRSLEVEPRRDGDYVLRAQPELLRGGRFSVAVRLTPTLAFPVSGRRESDVGSRFGAPRDGGSRAHHGVDIFAPRGTPVLATSPGVVSRVSENRLGGLVIWVTDDFGNRLYYAHLDRQLVAQGTRVNPGDTLGTVGNTGNARTTPPHLHFGVYRRGEGPMDPWWFVHRPRTDFPRLTADTTRLGDWIRTRTESVALLARPDDRDPPAMLLPRHTAARVLAVVGGWYRVRMPDGATGYLAARQTESVEGDAGLRIAAGTGPLLATPRADAAPALMLADTAIGGPVTVLGRFGGYLLVRTASGTAGWIEGG